MNKEIEQLIGEIKKFKNYKEDVLKAIILTSDGSEIFMRLNRYFDKLNDIEHEVYCERFDNKYSTEPLTIKCDTCDGTECEECFKE